MRDWKHGQRNGLCVLPVPVSGWLACITHRIGNAQMNPNVRRAPQQATNPIYSGSYISYTHSGAHGLFTDWRRSRFFRAFFKLKSTNWTLLQNEIQQRKKKFVKFYPKAEQLNLASLSLSRSLLALYLIPNGAPFQTEPVYEKRNEMMCHSIIVHTICQPQPKCGIDK